MHRNIRGGAQLMFVFLAAMLSACGKTRLLAHAYNGYRIALPLAKPAVVWSRTDGTPFDVRRETEGKVTLLYFGYTRCPDVCPAQLMNLTDALHHLGGDSASRFRVLFVTLDPDRDTSSVLRDWLRRFDPRFVALRAPRREVDREVARLGLAPQEPDSAGVVGPTHASAVVAYSRDDLAHFIYPATTNTPAWEYDLRKLLRDSAP